MKMYAGRWAICPYLSGQIDLTRLPPRDSTLDGRWTRKPFGLSRVHCLENMSTINAL